METRSEHIAADPEAVLRILEVSETLSIALVATLLKELREEVRAGFANIRRDPRVDALEGRIDKLRDSLLAASVKVHKLEQRIEELQKPASPPPEPLHDDVPEFG